MEKGLRKDIEKWLVKGDDFEKGMDLLEKALPASRRIYLSGLRKRGASRALGTVQFDLRKLVSATTITPTAPVKKEPLLKRATPNARTDRRKAPAQAPDDNEEPVRLWPRIQNQLRKGWCYVKNFRFCPKNRAPKNLKYWWLICLLHTQHIKGAMSNFLKWLTKGTMPVLKWPKPVWKRTSKTA